ncbi:hypothetical protein JZ751_007980 [Albula glossodonta]|uniref:Uncharacterized protein n=1 Tax=Albula glossodonta TaxID=121402 RepID=A0A8T2P972_9TELE|nr:hypothetical protein JZ751_007980 [Albula glossodonta]
MCCLQPPLLTSQAELCDHCSGGPPSWRKQIAGRVMRCFQCQPLPLAIRTRPRVTWVTLTQTSHFATVRALLSSSTVCLSANSV